MTPREPDRFEAKARELFRSLVMDEARAVPVIAAALRNAPDAALEEAARALDSHRYINASKIVRALASPAAAPEQDPMHIVAAGSVRGDAVHGAVRGPIDIAGHENGRALCGEENISITGEPWNTGSAYACKRCLRVLARSGEPAAVDLESPARRSRR